MPSTITTQRGEFRRIYRALQRKPELAARTPVFFCEGDSWFSTPLAMNLLDWLVFPTPEDEERGVPQFGAGGLFFRIEKSGDLAIDIFSERRIADLVDWYGGFEFDAVLISAGGNDFVADFLKGLFVGQSSMTPEQAFARVERSRRFEEVRGAYQRFLRAFKRTRPNTPILAHTYDYPQRMGEPARLTVANLGAAALLRDNIGPWIAPNIAHVLPQVAQQKRFAALLIDGFHDQVLAPLAARAEFSGLFTFVDLRGTLRQADAWFDEMHPTGAGFHTLSLKLRRAANALLPPAKRRA
ncbi:hypothetical protein [Lysobacter soli]|uniref:hypothetical protein n=1 Tax=Lysobacter soli TaxID=453783 RepID=UPI0024102227|nr:hypothetical protein [Lysobacter soli]MDG2517726.1 hypothetical protein [Lysobacter soli]